MENRSDFQSDTLGVLCGTISFLAVLLHQQNPTFWCKKWPRWGSVCDLQMHTQGSAGFAVSD